MFQLPSFARLLLSYSSLSLLFQLIVGSPYNASLVQWNINTNTDPSAAPTAYTTTRQNTTYTPSPDNWRQLPVYTVLLDKFADGDPTNNDFFGSEFESDWRETQLRYGGDLKGLVSRLDYLQGMGVGVIWIGGTIFLNLPWQADSYSPVDFTLVDPHFGTVEDWVDFIDAVHARGMYFMADFTIGTMGDLIGWKGYENESTPFDLNGYQAEWKDPFYNSWGIQQYLDFNFTNTMNTSCVLPGFWNEDGTPLTVQLPNGCYASEFDQFGDMEAFGVHPDWQRQISKFDGVQDRLREWYPPVMAKLQNFACMVLEALDIDAIRVDKSTQVTLDALAEWTTSVRNCASKLGKNNFMIDGEITGGNTFGALYIGRGRTPSMLPATVVNATTLTEDEDAYFLRDEGQWGLDGAAFQYSVYRALTRILGMDGNLEVADDIPVNLIDGWNEMIITNDYNNPNTGVFDPQHLLGVSNFDVFRWPGLASGKLLAAFGMFVSFILFPGIPLVYYGEEQAFSLFDNTASNYLYGRQPMTSTLAWQRHGCYSVGSDQYFNMRLQGAILGCLDDWNSLDHFDPTAELRRLIKQFNYLRGTFIALRDGFELVQWQNISTFEQLPGSNQTETEIAYWSTSRAQIPNVQNLTVAAGQYAGEIWIPFTNWNQSVTYTEDCQSPSWLISPYAGGTNVQNLLYPYETYTLANSLSPYGQDNLYQGCVESITMNAYDFKILVPQEQWTHPLPQLSFFSPGHDSRIEVPNAGSTSNIDIALGFDTAMDCTSITNSISLNMSSSGQGQTPAIDANSVSCTNLTNPILAAVQSVAPTVYMWNGTINNVPDGVLTITVNNPTTTGGTSSTNVKDQLMLRKGASNNVVVFPRNDYDASSFTCSNSNYTFEHKAFGADMFRYSTDFTQSWSPWQNWEPTTNIPSSKFDGGFWSGEHLIVQYYADATLSLSTIHADCNYGTQRRFPQFILRGAFNDWGYDNGENSVMENAGDGIWQLEIMASWPTFVQVNVFGYDNYFYGDTDGDGIMERLPPNSAAPNYLNMSAPPPGFLSWNLIINDQDLSWSLEPLGTAWVGATMYALLLSIPIITGTLAVVIFMWSFYGIRYNQFGFKPKSSSYFPILGSLGNKSAADLKSAVAPMSEKFDHLPSGEVIGWPEDKNKPQRTVLIATLEYEIIDWKLKVKIGGLGVMSSLMGKAMTDVNLIWVIPKVKDLEYPPGDPAEPIEVIIFGEPYLIEVETHVLDNITYVILDSPVFRAQTKSDPYPARMDDLSSAIFYSTWNQAIAATIKRFPQIDIYHINDYHGALAPIYLLPKVLPVCLSLHNAEFQGLWPLRTKEEMKEVCSAFNISKEHCTKYVQFGNTFNLLHAAASFISVHQKSIGVAGVSDKYGKRSWARYPALWTLKHVDSLPNPDPTDIAALDEQPISVADIKIDEEAEAKRPEFKRQAQEWAGIKQDPNSDLFVFVGRWSKQKGVDLIADVMPSLLEKRPSIQVICIGPVIDLYGRFAAEKLARLMELYPDRVFSKPEFTALPPYIFSGADFALIPSRDEPFGLVAVEFGRKGALGVGSRLGGLGLMPGWWFPVESTSTAHMQSQLTKTIKLALKSSQQERAILRARSAVQRFPVVEWRQRMEDFHKRSINVSRSHSGSNAWRLSDGETPAPAAIQLEGDDWDPNSGNLPRLDYDSRSIPDSPHPPGSPGQWSQSTLAPFAGDHLTAPPRITPDSRRGSISTDISENEDYFSRSPRNTIRTESGQGFDNFLVRANKQIAGDNRGVPDPFLDPANATPARPFGAHSRVSSVESIASIVEEKSNSPLNKAIASFTDADGEVAQEFMQKLQSLSAENSKGELSIERYLQKSEEAFFDRVRKEKLSSAASIRSSIRDSSYGAPSLYEQYRPNSPGNQSFSPSTVVGGLNPEDYSGPPMQDAGEVVVMSALQVALQRQIAGWPLYAIIIGIGQMLAATSFQITLLSGQNWQTDLQLYVLGGVFLASSVVWYTLFRLKPSVYVLSAPWVFYGIAFFLIGLPSISSVFEPAQSILDSIATWSYAVASAAAFLYFGLNFGEEAGAATEVWTMRACIVQGSQQIWVAALWYWGYALNGSKGASPPWWIVLILWPLAVMSFVFGYLLLFGLPEYYRQVPPKVPNFLKTLFRRRLVLWFLASEILRDYWLSGPYGRNWSFLWSAPIPKYIILILVIVFFIGVWGIMLWIITHLSKTHTWLLPVFAVGLGAPRWCQMLWGTSSLALYIPWAGSAGPYLGTSLWLWLGVLDAIQGVGLGMILLQTLSRLHVCATLAFAQIIGSICVMVARATAPDKIGPSSVFPNSGFWNFQQGLQGSPLASAPFWIAMICQIIIVLGYFWFYRREQLARP